MNTDFIYQGVGWSHRFVAVYKCFAKDQDSPVKTVEKLLVGDRGVLETDANLARVVASLHQDFLKKREVKYADNPTTRVMTFEQPEGGGENEARMHLDRLRRAESLEEIEIEASDLASRYLDTPGVRAGVLLFLVSRGQLDGEQAEPVAESCVYLFKCDFEPISEVAPDQLFHKIEDAIIEKAQKAAVYPRFDPDLERFEDTLIRIFDEKAETQYWLDYLKLGERRYERITQAAALSQILTQSHPKVAAEHGGQLRKLPRRRPLNDGKRKVKKSLRITTPQARRAAKKVIQETGEDPTVTFSLGRIRLTAPVSQYGQSWIIAEEGDRCYVLIKGQRLEVRTKDLTLLDVTRFESLKKAAKHLEIDCS